MSARGAAWRTGGVAALLGAGTLALYWPGVPMYDSVAQYGQALSGDYDDWHPPAMARLWAGLHAILGGAGGPMFALQVALWWLGLGLVAAALAREGRRVAPVLVLAAGVWPPFLGWQATILKDAQMAGAMLAAVGLVGWWRLRGRRVPWLAVAAAAVLLTYAALVRANAVFAVVPLAAMLAPGWRPRTRAIAAVLGIGAVLAVSGPINHDLLGAERTGVERTEAIYDLAGIAVRSPAGATPLPADAVRTLVARRCVKGFFWDPLGEPTKCDDVVDPLRDVPPVRLHAALAAAAFAHPLAYAEHRLTHLDSTDRWLVGAHWPGASPPQGGQPNDLGLRDPARAAFRAQRWASLVADWPLAWPAAWIVVAAVAAVIGARRAPEPARDLSLALAASALTLEASFAVLSIASDLRYHLWSMVAAALSAALLVGGSAGRGERRTLVVGGAALASVIVAGLVARAVLPEPPQSYAGMLAW